jgi:hypothetical protein
MTDFATDLKKMFNATMFDRLEAYWVLPDGKSFDRSDEDTRAIGIFEVLLATVDAIPPALIEIADELRATDPDRTSDAFFRCLRSVGYGFSPASATEFIEELNRAMQCEMARA